MNRERNTGNTPAEHVLNDHVEVVTTTTTEGGDIPPDRTLLIVSNHTHTHTYTGAGR